MRIGIKARFTKNFARQKRQRPISQIVSGKEDIEIFTNLVKAVGERRINMLEKIETFISKTKATQIVTRFPAKYGNDICSGNAEKQYQTMKKLEKISGKYCGTGIYKQNFSRERALRIAAAVESDELKNLAQSNIYWDEIVSIEFAEETEVLRFNR